jgi:hypothetical protein
MTGIGIRTEAPCLHSASAILSGCSASALNVTLSSAQEWRRSALEMGPTLEAP